MCDCKAILGKLQEIRTVMEEGGWEVLKKVPEVGKDDIAENPREVKASAKKDKKVRK